MFFRIVNILHSGRKGIRNTPVTDQKYNGMVNSIIKLRNNNIENIHQFDELRFDFVETESEYDLWRSSCVIAISLGYDNLYYVETINTIYVLEEVKDYKWQE